MAMKDPIALRNVCPLLLAGGAATAGGGSVHTHCWTRADDSVSVRRTSTELYATARYCECRSTVAAQLAGGRDGRVTREAAEDSNGCRSEEDDELAEEEQIV